MSLSPERAAELLEAFPRQRILVVGDLMLDRYVMGRVDRISPEAPVPVIHVEEEHTVPGGACNVAANIQTLGGQAVLAGVVGKDPHGDELLQLLKGQAVDVSGVVRSEDVGTITKTRVLAGRSRQQICRVDREGDGFGTPAERAFFAERLSACTGVILEDYGKGVITHAVVRRVLDRANELDIPSGFDPKTNREIDCSGVSLIKPNRKEALGFAGFADSPTPPRPLDDTTLLDAASCLLEQWQPGALLVTLGPGGMLLVENGKDPQHVPTRAREVYDVSGAGDTVIATCITAMAAGATLREAAELANAAAGIVVAKLGTATCTADELLAEISAEQS